MSSPVSPRPKRTETSRLRTGFGVYPQLQGLLFVAYYNHLFSPQMSTEHLLCATVSFRTGDYSESGHHPGIYQRNEFCLSKHFEVASSPTLPTHCVALREYFLLSGLLPFHCQNKSLKTARILKPPQLWHAVLSLEHISLAVSQPKSELDLGLSVRVRTPSIRCL